GSIYGPSGMPASANLECVVFQPVCGRTEGSILHLHDVLSRIAYRQSATLRVCRQHMASGEGSLRSRHKESHELWRRFSSQHGRFVERRNRVAQSTENLVGISGRIVSVGKHSDL